MNFILTILVVTFSSSLLIAEGRRIAVVDLQKVLDQSIVGKASRSNLEKDMKESKAKIERDKMQFGTKASELNKQKALLSAEAFENKQIELMSQERDLQRKIGDAQEELQRKTMSTIDKITKEVVTIAEQVAKKEGYEFVLEKDVRFIVYADSSVDVTEQVVEILDQKKMNF